MLHLFSLRKAQSAGSDGTGSLQSVVGVQTCSGCKLSKLATACCSDFLSFAASRHPCPSSTLSSSDPHARSVFAALAALNSEGYKLKDLTGFPRRIYAAPTEINPLRRGRVDWDLVLNNGNGQTFLPLGVILP